MAEDKIKDPSKELYNSLQKRRKKIKRTSILLALFALGVNIFAWFVYATHIQTTLDATVKAWDIEFKDGPTEVNAIYIAVNNMLPGMIDYNKRLTITNKGEVAAEIEYHVEDFIMFGRDFMEEGFNEESFTEDMVVNYPFNITFVPSDSEIGVNETIDFDIDVNWAYEDAYHAYYDINKYYDYDSSITYYYLNNGNYIVDNNVTAVNYLDKVNELYVNKDDADSYFGYMCGKYEKDTGQPCLEMKVKITAKQKSS